MEDLQQYERDLDFNGFCIVAQVIPPGACAPIRDRMIQVTQRHHVEGPAVMQVSFVPGVINHDQSFAPYLADPRVMALANKLLGPHVRISFTSAIINEPGKPRTNWHADRPFNQKNGAHVPAPYPDHVMHLTSLIMVSPFTIEKGGTLIVPRSHRFPSNPSDPALDMDPYLPYPTEHRVIGSAGSMLLFDSRLWHCPPGNPSDEPRVAIAVRYAPWWLNLESLDPDSDLWQQMVIEQGRDDNIVPRAKRPVFASLPKNVQPLYRH